MVKKTVDGTQTPPADGKNTVVIVNTASFFFFGGGEVVPEFQTQKEDHF